MHRRFWQGENLKLAGPKAGACKAPSQALKRSRVEKLENCRSHASVEGTTSSVLPNGLNGKDVEVEARRRKSGRR
jgi:hypothetical protein